MKREKYMVVMLLLFKRRLAERVYMILWTLLHTMFTIVNVDSYLQSFQETLTHHNYKSGVVI